jgi:hypothetical protein
LAPDTGSAVWAAQVEGAFDGDAAAAGVQTDLGVAKDAKAELVVNEILRTRPPPDWLFGLRWFLALSAG